MLMYTYISESVLYGGNDSQTPNQHGTSPSFGTSSFDPPADPSGDPANDSDLIYGKPLNTYANYISRCYDMLQLGH